MDTYSQVEDLAKSLGVKILYKDESPFMRLLGVLLFFNPNFMHTYTTTMTFLSTVYFPSRDFVTKDPVGAAMVLAHELVHIMDSRTVGQANFTVEYLYPQCLAGLSLLALLAIPFSLTWLLALPFLLCLVPLPSPGRAWIEYRGYAMTLAVGVWSGRKYDHIPLKMVEQFTGPNYYYMDRDHDNVVTTLRGWLADIESGAVASKLPLVDRVQPIFARASKASHSAS